MPYVLCHNEDCQCVVLKLLMPYVLGHNENCQCVVLTTGRDHNEPDTGKKIIAKTKHNRPSEWGLSPTRRVK